jgi:integrase
MPDTPMSYVSALLHQGVDARTVADLAGHKDPAMTLRRYAHSLPSSRQGAADKLDLALSGERQVC